MPSSPEPNESASADLIGRSALALRLLCLLLVSAAPARADGDAARGEKIYERCIACHSIDRDRTGPNHKDLLGPRVGSVPGFAYSSAMKNAGASGMAWDEATLEKFLEDPTKFIPGTRMGYAGIKNPQERADLVAYLKNPGAAR